MFKVRADCHVPVWCMAVRPVWSRRSQACAVGAARCLTCVAGAAVDDADLRHRRSRRARVRLGPYVVRAVYLPYHPRRTCVISKLPAHARLGARRFREFVLGVWSLLSLDREDLAGFSFFLYDHDYNGHLELSELMNILNDVHGEGLANPNGRSASTPHYTRAVQHFQAFSKKKHGSTRHLTVEGKAKECYVTIGEFVTFTKNTPSLLWPAFRLQTDVSRLLRSVWLWACSVGR